MRRPRWRRSVARSSVSSYSSRDPVQERHAAFAGRGVVEEEGVQDAGAAAADMAEAPGELAQRLGGGAALEQDRQPRRQPGAVGAGLAVHQRRASPCGDRGRESAGCGRGAARRGSRRRGMRCARPSRPAASQRQRVGAVRLLAAQVDQRADAVAGAPAAPAGPAWGGWSGRAGPG